MDVLTTMVEVKEHLAARRLEWETLLAKIPPALLEKPGVEGQWSIKDIMAHIAYYERWLAGFLEAGMRGEEISLSDFDKLEMHTRNEQIYLLYRHRPLEEVLEDARQSYSRLVKAVMALNDEDFNPGSRFEKPIAAVWGEVFPLDECIGGDSFDHYTDHIPDIQNWLETSS